MQKNGRWSSAPMKSSARRPNSSVRKPSNSTGSSPLSNGWTAMGMAASPYSSWASTLWRR